MTAGLLEDLVASDISDVEFTWRVWGSTEPFVILRTEKVSLMHCPTCGQKVLAHMILHLADAWFHSLTANDYHWRFNDTALDAILDRRSS